MIHRLPPAYDSDPDENPPDSDLHKVPDIPPRPQSPADEATAAARHGSLTCTPTLQAHKE